MPPDGTLPSTATATTVIPFFNANNFNQGLRGMAFVPNQSPVLSGSNTNLPPLFENPVKQPRATCFRRYFRFGGESDQRHGGFAARHRRHRGRSGQRHVAIQLERRHQLAEFPGGFQLVGADARIRCQYTDSICPERRL